MMTLIDAASELGLSPATLRRQIANGALRGRKVGNTWTITRRELDRYRVEHRGRTGQRSPHKLRPRRRPAGVPVHAEPGSLAARILG